MLTRVCSAGTSKSLCWREFRFGGRRCLDRMVAQDVDGQRDTVDEIYVTFRLQCSAHWDFFSKTTSSTQ